MKRWMTILLCTAMCAFVVAVFLPTKEDGDAMRQELDRFQVRSLGLSCKMYAEDNGGRFPEDWFSLLRYMNTTGVFRGATGRPDKPAVLADIMRRTDAVYVRGATTSSPPNTVVAFLPPGYYRKHPEAIVLYADGKEELQVPAVFAKTRKHIPNQASQAIGAAAPQPERSRSLR